MRTPKNALSKTEHRKGAAGHRQGAGRVSNDALLHHTGPGWMSAAPGRYPCGLLKGTLRLQILNIYRASSGLRWICNHGRRRYEIRKGPARSRNSTASRRVRKSHGARWICESPLKKVNQMGTLSYIGMLTLSGAPSTTSDIGYYHLSIFELLHLVHIS